MNLDYLNDIQKEAVLHTDGPMMILAGAGSGKTRTLVAKIEYLLKEKKISTSHLLAMTFSNRAAKEMRDRIEKALGISSNNYFITTRKNELYPKNLVEGIKASDYSRKR